MTEGGREPTRLKAADFVGALASLVIALAGSMYLASYTAKTVLLDHFGLTVDMFATSVQAQMADGAIMLEFFLMMFALLLVGLGMTGLSVRLLNEAAAKKKGMEPARWSGGTSLFLKRSLFISSCLLAVILAPALGSWKGAADLNQTQLLLQQHCAVGCYTYSTTNDNFVGVNIAADPTRIAIATTSGARLIEMSSLRNIAPYLPRK
jgi:hypothetical protein